MTILVNFDDAVNSPVSFRSMPSPSVEPAHGAHALAQVPQDFGFGNFFWLRNIVRRKRLNKEPMCACDAFQSEARHFQIKPYPIPYRCLYSRNIENLMMAGRNISVTHVALGTVRVMRTTGMMGEVLGMAASLCKKHSTTPRGVYEQRLDELKALMERGVGKQDLP